ncbi:MAG: NAD(P)H-flavin reductase/ferredoxin [Candidatus Azotimanducaceae bacterium]
MFANTHIKKFSALQNRPLSLITYNNSCYESEAGESALDTLLRHDINIPYACKAGVCHVCVMQCLEGTLPSGAVIGLKDSQVAHGNFLACQCIPTESLTVNDADKRGLFSQVKVIEKDKLSPDICRIRMRTATDLYYRAGQFVNLRMNDKDIRSYSLASLPTKDDFLELHIKRMQNGVVSNWLFGEVKTGDVLEIQGPFGDCFYMPHNINAEILMIGTGTGLAPLIGILRDAITSGHRGQISLYHGERNVEQLYLVSELRELVAQHTNIRYFPCASTKNTSQIERIFEGRASDHAFASNKNLSDKIIYLCGSAAMVDESRDQAQLNGAKSENIFADPFVTKDLRLDVRN